ncbi:Kelch-like H-associated protein 1A [Goodea atripinnis]|uniref:Kelch-like H-associated protein 1A n=1 Tax=Goodea atripinnis TaxID=208336 RepID=A0ABV0PFS6_9TELE
MEGRSQYLHALLNAVHIYALPPKFLKNQLLSCPILSKKRLSLPPCGSCRKHSLASQRRGIYRQHSLTTMQAYDPRKKVWIKLADMGTPCSGLGACTLFGLIYTVGGRNLSLQTNLDSSFLCCYNPMTNQWSQRASLNIPRNRVGVAVVDGCIYAVGGSEGSVHHNTVERWDPECNRWSFVCPMSVARLGAGVAASGGALYVVGGYDGQNRWNTAERYQPDTNTWHPLAPMNTMRSGLGLVSLNSYLYAIGGYDGQNQLCTVERYNIGRNIWEPRAPMKHCRSALGVAVHQGRIYVFGQS